MDPEPVTAWVVRPAAPDPERVRLHLEGRFLIFERDRERKRVDLRGLSRVRRTRGTPVLTLRWPDRELLLYFDRPPVEGAAPAIPGTGMRGLERTAGLIRLRAANRALKPLVEGWAAAIRRAAED